MKFHEVEALLAMISDIDRKPFPSTAAATWYEILESVGFEYAKQAVLEHYKGSGARDGSGNARPVLPVDVRSRANALRDHDQRQKPALPAGRVGSADRPPHVMAALAEARRAAELAAAKYAEAAA